MTAKAPARPDLDWDAEQDVDLGRLWGALGRLWWLPLAGLVLGALLGYLASLGGSQVYSAKATLYLGQPYSASGNIQLQSAQTNPSTVRAIVSARATQDAAARAAGLRPGQLGGHVSVAAVAGNLAKLGQTPLVTIGVQGPTKAKVARAANALAEAVVANPAVAGYPDQKIQLLRSQIVNAERTINDIRRALASGAVSPTDRLIASIQLRTAQQDFSNAGQLLAQARQVETPRVVTSASGSKVTARSRRNSLVVAAIVGLIVGILAGLAWDAVASRAGRAG